jgi:predicted dienelactone hydrolase
MQGYVMVKIPHFDVLSWQVGMRWWRSSIAAANLGFANLVFAGLVMLLSLPSHAATQNIGFREITQSGVNIAVWYPTNAPHNQSRLGPFDVDYARDAKPVAGRFPLVLLSHGHSGRPRNHHLTAAALVRAGYVVAAPQHRFDHLVFQSRLIYAMHQRIAEITTAHRAVVDHPVIGPVIDDGPVHGLGYSLGSATLMASSIAAVDIAALKSHCYANAAKDPLFCKSPSLLVWIFHALQTIGKDHSASRTKPQDSVVTGKMVLVAPVGRGLILQPIAKKIDAVMVLAIRNDQHVPPRYHANYLTALMGPDHVGDVDHVEVEDGHHFAFIAPFAKRVTREETIPVALDPAGFDRVAWLDKVNQQIVGFIQR